MMKKLFRITLLLLLAILVVAVLSVFKSNFTNEIRNDVTIKESTYGNISPQGASGQKRYKYRIYETIPEDIVQKITGISYLQGGPVSLEKLAYIKLTYWGFDDTTHLGEIIIYKGLAQELVEIFEEICAAKFPIAKMRLIDEYQADDELSMADNNTSALCMRTVRGSSSYSMHSFGVAIDINPIQNPYLWQGTILPQAGRDYVDRENHQKGMIVKGDVVYEAFKNRGWTWGGEWKTLKDYQHFQKNLTVESVD